MKAPNKADIITLFETYRYRTLQDGDDVLIFEYATGIFNGVQIVPINRDLPGETIDSIRREYSSAGYATHVYETCDIEQIQKDLFNGFFQTKLSNERIKNKYLKYCERVMLQYGKYPEDYEYIEVPFEKEVDFLESKPDDHLVDAIYSMLQGEGARLIILEAPAGFGKTSTAYEVLSRYQGVTADVRPFMMELYKDRTASIFKYILLSNIDTDFDVTIKSDIVIENIKAGRIPLLVDGFDELLSKDIDNGVNNYEFKEIESMLSTIADLLTGNAKILLTSRKTAIFSGEEFFEWYDNLRANGKDFQIVKYSLCSPTLKDWLAREDIAKYDKTLLSALNNPVLLGFLRYCGKDLGDSQNAIVDRFFNLLLKREIERQDLPFSVEEQKTIMRRLAMVLAGFNCSTDTRGSVMSIISETSSDLITSKVTAVRDRDSLLNTLTNHALLNRKNDKIGFLNDFIYGIMLAESFLNYNKDDDTLGFASSIPAEFLRKCINASVYLSDDEKQLIHQSLKSNATFGIEDGVLCDLKLVGNTKTPISGLSFIEDRLTNCSLGQLGATMVDCTFSNISFTNCSFDFDYLSGCTFVQCTFDNCIREGINLTCYGYGCIDSDDILRIDEVAEETSQDKLTDEDVKLSILDKYFMVDKQRRRMKLISAVRKNYVKNEKQFKRCLDSLASDKLLIINGDKSFITDEGEKYYKQNYTEL